MCGIAGYTGPRESVPIAIEAIKKLEYRGYDSAGIAVINAGKIHLLKNVGKIKDLENILPQLGVSTGTVIAHTRWATHGEPTNPNAHPHTDGSNTVAVIHNGIIENYHELRELLKAQGHVFSSDTDSETIPHLIQEKLKLQNGTQPPGPEQVEQAIRESVKMLRGSYAVVCICKYVPGYIYVARKDSPIVVGLGEGENFVASDIPALLSHTRRVQILEDGDFAVVRPDGVHVSTLDGTQVSREILTVSWDDQVAEKGGYEHFMIKEIHEQPKAIKDTLMGRLSENRLDLAETGFPVGFLASIKRVSLVACGTAYYASVVGKHLIESLCGIPADAEVASEFRYREPLLDPGTLVIAVSQSGETADTLGALRLAKRRGCRTLAIVNVVGSSLAREADHVLYTRAGLEICVVSTKAYGTQLVALYLLAAHLAKSIPSNPKAVLADQMLGALADLPYLAQHTLLVEEQMRDLAKSLQKKEDFFFLGRGLDYCVSLEGALKLKEVSYLHAEAYPGGELKHGPLALITRDVPVIVSLTQPHLYEKMVSNIQEVRARGATVIGILSKSLDDTLAKTVLDHIIYIPSTHPLIAPSLAIIPAQFLGYYIAKELGCEIDQPRNLAKSVTVE